MNILLVAINAKYIHSNLAIYNLKACAKEFEDSIKLAEFTINEYPDVILREICKERPDFVAVSCYIWNKRHVEEIFMNFNKIFPDVPLWIGGPEVSYESEVFLEEHPCFTGVMKGEGEETFYEVLRQNFKDGFRLEDIEGITFRNSEGIIIKNRLRRVIDMDRIPFVYKNIEAFKNKIVYYESSRGCPFSCSYCLSSIEKQVRFRDIGLVKEELLFFIENNVSLVKFVDRTFNCDRIRAREIWKFIAENDRGVTNFHFEIGADLLQEEDFNIFKSMREGLIQLEIGIQSTNKVTLREIKRAADLEKIKLAAENIRKNNNIHQHLDLIAGLPWEDFDSFKNSFNEVFSLRPNQLQLGFLKVLKGSHIYEKSEEYGIKYNNFPPYEVLYTNWITYEDIVRLKGVEEMVETYYNSQQFCRSLEETLKYYDNAFDFFDEIADFYEKKDYNRKNHSRIARYDILREFVKERLHRDTYKKIEECLIYDLYARENLKSRPNWALSQLQYKDLIYGFYRREEENPVYLKGYENYNFKQMLKMTHIEVFEKTEDGKSAYLFDYQNRNPVNKSAKITKISFVDFFISYPV